jgi:uncharacterized protein YqgC (DUF456 family)
MKFSTKQTITHWAALVGFIVGCFINYGNGHHPTKALFFAIGCGVFSLCAVAALFAFTDRD